MKAGPSRRKAKKALTVATALTGVTAGAAGLLPATAAYAASGGWKVKITMGAAVTFATFCGNDLKNQRRCESAFNPTSARLSSVPFTDGGVVRTYTPQQVVTLQYGGPSIGVHSTQCLIPPGGGTVTWFANGQRVTC
jgi:hypothetical protein